MWADVAFYKIFSTVSVLFMTLDGPQGAEGDASANVDHHLEQGKRLLAAGQLTEALSHYHSAIEGDPSNYMSYFKRATVLLALGRSKSALPDLTNTIELRPDFLKARTQRGNIYFKQGKLEDAKEDYTIVVDKEPSNQEAITKLTSINPLKEEIEAGRAFFEDGDYEAAVQSLTNPVEQCPWNIELRELRAKGNEFIGEYFKAIQDLRVTTKLFSDNTEGYLKMSQLYYQLGEGDDSLKEIRECLKLDQDHKRCHTHYKKVKKLVKFFTDAQNYMDRNNYVDAIFKLNAALKMESRNIKFLVKAKEKLCTSHLKMSEANEAIKVCTETIEIESQNVNAYCDRAEAYLLLEDKLEEALVDFQKAKEINNDLRRAKEGIARVNKLIKQSKKRDYYKILGVSRSASKSEIAKKFRKLAAKWHPDKHKGKDRKEAEKKFIDLAHAKEVLSDPEKRAKYDQGEDPLDPETQQQQGPSHGFNGFQEGFGEGFNFKFHFN